MKKNSRDLRKLKRLEKNSSKVMKGRVHKSNRNKISITK